MTQRLSSFALSAAIVALDRLTKIWIEASVGPYDTLIIIPGFLNIIHTTNRGMAFSLFSDASELTRRLLLIGVSLLVMGFVAVMLWQSAARSAGKWQRLALSLVLGGAIGNLHDRIFSGAVTDFVDLYLGDYHWPTFNIADSAITVGAVFLLLDLWRGRAQQTAVA
jgi:signal peptidase II